MYEIAKHADDNLRIKTNFYVSDQDIHLIKSFGNLVYKAQVKKVDIYIVFSLELYSQKNTSH